MAELEQTVQRRTTKNESYLPWEEAREFVQQQMLSSRAQYEKWWDREKPKVVSKYPYRVYRDEWTSWNDFLGNNNKFNERANIKWRTMDDVIPDVHKLELNSQEEWTEYARINKDSDFFKDVPARPDLVYKNWRGWGYFLGKTTAAVIEAQQQLVKQQIYSIVHIPGEPMNVFHFAVDANPSVFRERMEDQQFEIIKTYWFNPNVIPSIEQVLEAFSKQYMEGRRQRFTQNIYDILWHLDRLMDPVKRGEV